jgi:hypothetical protein
MQFLQHGVPVPYPFKGTVSGDFLHHIFFHESSFPTPLKMDLKKKIYLYVNSFTQRCPNMRIFEKISISPKGILRGLGETDS